MDIRVNTDNHISGSESLQARVEARLHRSLGRFAEAVTTIEVHLGDVNAAQPGDDDKRCLIEVRLANRPPAAASHHGATLDEAMRGAIQKMRRRLDRTIGRIGEKKGAETIRKDDLR